MIMHPVTKEALYETHTSAYVSSKAVNLAWLLGQLNYTWKLAKLKQKVVTLASASDGT